MSCAPTLESTSSCTSIVPSWLGVIGTRAGLFFKILVCETTTISKLQKEFLGTYCFFMDKIFCNQSNCIWSKVKRQFNSVVGDWEKHPALRQTGSVWNKNGNELLFNCINQLGVDTNMPFMEWLFLVQVRVWLIVIGGEKTSKMEEFYYFGSHDSSFLENNKYHYRQTTYFSVFAASRTAQNVAARSPL